MESNKIKLLYLGSNCAPSILTSELLNNNQKLPFQLMITTVRTIMDIIRDDFQFVVDSRYLLNSEKQTIDSFESTIESHGHGSTVYHSKYNIKFVHDFTVVDNKIMNYNFIQSIWQEKIQNFTNIMNSSDYKIFVHFENKVNLNELKEFETFITEKYNTSNVHILAFGRNNETVVHGNIHIYKLKLFEFGKWWTIPVKDRIDMYREIYAQFVDFMISLNVDILKFEETDIFRRLWSSNE